MHVRISTNWIVTLLLVISVSGVYSQFSVFPASVTSVIEGNSLTLQCSYPNATQITWRRDVQVLRPGDANYVVLEINPSTSNLTLSSADRVIHNGSYECIATTATNTNETISFEVLVTYLDENIQVIIAQTDPCANGKIYSGSNVTLQCAAPDGFPPPNVSWFHNGVKVRDFEHANIDFSSMKRILVITGIYTNQSGEWLCVADNGIERTSLPTDINIIVPSSIERTVMIVAPENRIVYAELGEPATLSCIFNPPLTKAEKSSVLWNVDSGGITNGERGYSLFVLSCSVLLRIDSLGPSHEGTYRCAFNGVSSQAVVLDIATIRQTYSVSVVPSSPVGKGKSVEFRCLPQGEPGNNDETISWRFRSSTTGLVTSVLTDGRILVQEEGTKVIITDARVDDTGEYICAATNPLTAEVTNTLNLVVEDPPPITVTPPNPTVKLGTPLTLTCDISSSRMVTLTWMFNGNSLTETSGRFTITNTPLSSTLRILTVEESDLGNVTCKGDDPVHFPVYASSLLVENTTLYLYGDRGTRNFSFVQNTEFRLDCDVRGGDGTATVMWFKGNKEIPFQNGAEMFSILSFPNGTSSLRKEDSILQDEIGDYQCKVQEGGATLSQKFNILIMIQGAFVRSPPGLTNATVGERFQLDCIVSGRPLPAITWLYKGMFITSLNDSSVRDLGNGSLVFDPVSMDHSGTYVCSINNPSFVFRETMLMVAEASDGSTFIRTTEDIILLSIGLIAAVFLLLTAAFIVTLVCVRLCYARSSRTSGRYDVKQDSPDGVFLRQPSLRDRKDNSGILSQSPSNDLFGTLRKSPETSGTFHFTGSDPYASNTTSIQLGMYGASNSMLSEKFPVSQESTPLHEAMPFTSMYSSEDRTSVTGSLPNYPRSNLELGDVMGEGEFGPVVLGVANHIVSTQDKTLVAVKVLLPRGDEEEGLRPDLALVDFANQMKLEYINIASILGICSDMEPYYVIYEYLDQGDLKKFLLHSQPEDGDPPSLTPSDMRKMILQVADGMAWLFSQRIIHGDLASRNCLISSSLQVKIADLGIGHDLYGKDYFDNGAQLLPIRWMPPELLEQMEESPSFSLHSDIWSFGVFCWEVFAYAKLPYDSYNDDEILTMIPAGSRLRKPSASCPDALYDLMTECWDEDPDRRPQFARLCVAIVDLDFDRYTDFSQ